MFNKMKIGTKINFIFLVIVLIFAIVIGIYTSSEMGKGMEERVLAKVASDNELGFQYLNEAQPGEWQIKDGELFKGDEKVNDATGIVDKIKEWTESEATIFQDNVRVSTTIKEANGDRAVKTEASPEVSEAVLENGQIFKGEADILGEMYLTEYRPIKNAADEVIGMWLVAYPMSGVHKMTNAFVTIIIIVLVVMVLLSGVSITLFTRNLKKRIGKVVEVSQAIAEGNLATGQLSFKEQDEIGQLATAVNRMNSNLRSVIQQITEVSETVTAQSEELTQSADEVKSGSEQVATTMQELASGSEVQANHASELSSLMGSFTSKVQDANRDGEYIHTSSNHVLNLTNEGSELMAASTEQMKKVDQIVRDVVRKMENLDAQSQKISNLVYVIKDISDQTNLLALNAAIEAARAGEHGKGFAVVADEVRKLAEQVSVSVTDITGIVEDIQRETDIVTESLKDGYKEVEKGTGQNDLTGRKFENIRSAVTEMAEKIQTVSETLFSLSQNSNDMHASIQEIASISERSAAGVEQTSASAQQTSSSMDEVAASSSELANLAEKLNGMVRQFKY